MPSSKTQPLKSRPIAVCTLYEKPIAPPPMTSPTASPPPPSIPSQKIKPAEAKSAGAKPLQKSSVKKIEKKSAPVATTPKPKASTVTPKKTPPISPPKPSPKPPTSSTASSSASKAKAELRALVKESLDALNTPTQTHSSSSSSPITSKIGTLSSEALLFSASYEEELVNRLQQFMILPEQGRVKIALTIKREGTLEKAVILDAPSASNRRYVETTLADLCFPPFGKNFSGEKSHTFSVVLTSENSH